MRIRFWAILVLLALSGCEEEDAAQVESPDPVAPVEVAPAEDEPDVAALQARVAELEAQLAAQPEGEDAVEPTTPEAADLPEGVDAPEEIAAVDEDAEGSEESASASRDRRRRRDDQPILINPLDVLLGD